MPNPDEEEAVEPRCEELDDAKADDGIAERANFAGHFLLEPKSRKIRIEKDKGIEWIHTNMPSLMASTTCTLLFDRVGDGLCRSNRAWLCRSRCVSRRRV